MYYELPDIAVVQGSKKFKGTSSCTCRTCYLQNDTLQNAIFSVFATYNMLSAGFMLRCTL